MDGSRFPITAESVLELDTYAGRTVPANTEWMKRLDVMTAGEYARRQTANGEHTPR